jgi:hypothetical protein
VAELATMSRGERSAKLLEHMALASRVFGVFVDGANGLSNARSRFLVKLNLVGAKNKYIP